MKNPDELKNTGKIPHLTKEQKAAQILSPRSFAESLCRGCAIVTFAICTLGALSLFNSDSDWSTGLAFGIFFGGVIQVALLLGLSEVIHGQRQQIWLGLCPSDRIQLFRLIDDPLATNLRQPA